MKVWPLSPAPPAPQQVNRVSSGRDKPPSSPAGGACHITCSERAWLASRVAETIRGLPALRTDRIRDCMRMLERGTQVWDAEKIAAEVVNRSG